MLATAELHSDLLVIVSSSARWFALRHRNPTSTALRESGSPPTRIFRHHPEDKVLNFLRDPFSPSVLTYFREQAPVPAKSRSVPSDNGFRADEDKRLLPRRPKTAGEEPEDFVNPSELGPWMFAFEDAKLLPQS